MFERFTDRARRVLVLAQEEARLMEHNFLGTEHLLIALLQEGEGVAATALTQLGADIVGIRALVGDAVVPGAPGTASGAPPFTPRSKKVLEFSLREALDMGHNYIGTEHLLLGLVREGEGVGAQVLMTSGLNLDKVRAKVLEMLDVPRPPGDVGRPGGGAPSLGLHRGGWGGRGTGFSATPAGAAIRNRAFARAGADPLASHHYLLAHFDDPRSLATRVLESLGVTEAAVLDRIGAMGVAGTSDEVPKPEAKPGIEIGLGGGLTLAVDNPELAEQLRATIEEVGDPGEAGELAVVIRKALADHLRPGDPLSEDTPSPLAPPEPPAGPGETEPT